MKTLWTKLSKSWSSLRPVWSDMRVRVKSVTDEILPWVAVILTLLGLAGGGLSPDKVIGIFLIVVTTILFITLAVVIVRSRLKNGRPRYPRLQLPAKIAIPLALVFAVMMTTLLLQPVPSPPPPTPVPTPMAISRPTPTLPGGPATPDEILIVVARFGGDNMGEVVTNSIVAELTSEFARLEQEKSPLRVRVEPYLNSVPAKAQEAADIGREAKATLVIWGTAKSLDSGGGLVRAYYEIVGHETEIQARPNLAYASTGNTSDAAGTIDDMRREFILKINGLPDDYRYLALLSVGQIAYSTHDYKTAISYFDQALASPSVREGRQDLALPSAYFYRGYAHRQLGQYPAAIADYTKAVELDPENLEYYRFRGFVHLLSGNFSAAVEDYRAAVANCDQALLADQLNAAAYLSRAQAYYLLGDSRSALSDDDKAIQLDPNNARAYAQRGDVLYYRRFEYESAISAYSQAIKLAPETASYYVDRGQAYQDISNFEQAIADFTSATQLDPHNANAYYFLGNALIDSGRLKDGLAVFDQALGVNPKDAVSLATRAWNRFRLDQNDAAAQDYAAAVAACQNPSCISWVFSLQAGSYVSVGEMNNALLALNQALEANPLYTTALRDRGDVFRQMGQAERGLDDLNEVVRICEYANCLPWAYNSRANYFDELGYPIEAIEDYSRALEVEPNYYWAAANRGRVHRYLGDYAAAIRDIDAGIAMNPGDPWPHKQQGVTYESMGNYTLALNSYAQALAVDPYDTDALTDRADLYLLQGNYSLALADIDRALKIDDRYGYAYVLRARVSRAMGKRQAALDDYVLAMQVDPGNSQAYSSYAFLAYELPDKRATALATLDAFIAHFPYNADGYANRASFYNYALNDQKAALEDYTRAVEHAPAEWWWLSYRSMLLNNMGRTDEARRDTDLAIQLSPHNPQAYLRQIDLLTQQKDFTAALDTYAHIIELEPGSAVRYQGRAQVHQQKRDLEAALQDLNMSVALAPDAPALYRARALFYRSALNDNERALDDYTRMIEIDPMARADYGTSFALVARAGLLQQIGKPDAAMADLDRLVALFPQSAQGYMERARFRHFTLKNYAAALADYDQAIRLLPDQSDLYQNRADVRLTLGQHQAALKDFDQFARLQPDNPISYAYRGNIYSSYLHDTQAAIREFAHALGIDPLFKFYGGIYLMASQAELYEQAGDGDAALASLNRLVDLAPADLAPLAVRARFYLRQGNQEAALDDLSRVIDHDPLYRDDFLEAGGVYNDDYMNSARQFAILARSRLLWAMDRQDEARADLDRAAKISPGNAALFVERARLYSSLGELAAADADFATAIGLEPQNTTWVAARAEYYRAQQNTLAALADYNRWVSLAPDDPSALAGRASFYEEQSDFPAALADLDRLVEIDPRFTFRFRAEPAFIARARLLVEMKELDAARAGLSAIDALPTADPEMYIARSDFYLEVLGDQVAALADLERVATIDPLYQSYFYGNRDIALIHQARLLWNMDRHSEALAVANRVDTIDPPSPLAFERRGDFYHDKEYLAEAQADYAHLIDLNPDWRVTYSFGSSEFALIVRARWLWQAGQHDEAMAVVSEIETLLPGSLDALWERAQFYQATANDPDKALVDYTRIIETNPLFFQADMLANKTYALEQRVDLYIKRGDLAAARADYDRLVDMLPNDVNMRVLRGEFLVLTMKDFAGAIPDYAAIVSQDPRRRLRVPIQGSAGAQFAEAELLWQVGRHDEALDLAKKATDLSPHNLSILAERVAFHEQVTNDLQAALTDLSEIVDQNPEYGVMSRPAIQTRANLYIRLKQPEAALTDLDRAIELEIGLPDNMLAAAALAIDLGKAEKADYYWDQTVDFLRQKEWSPDYVVNYYGWAQRPDLVLLAVTHGIEKEPDELAWYVARFQAYQRGGQHDQALADCLHISEVNPLYDLAADHYGGEALYPLEMCASEAAAIGKIQEGLEMLDRLVALTPDRALSYWARARYYDTRMNNTQLALQDLSRAVEIDPLHRWLYSSDIVLIERADLNHRLGNLDAALADYSRAILLAGPRASWLDRRGVVHYDLREYELAASDYTAALRIGDADALVFIHRGDVRRIFLGQPDQALADYTGALNRDPDNDRAYYSIGVIYAEKGDFSSALENLTRAIEINDMHPWYVAERASVYHEIGDDPRALADCDRAIQLVKDVPDSWTYIRVANTHYAMGRYQEAIQENTRALEILPNDNIALFQRGKTNHALNRLDAAYADLSAAIAVDNDFSGAYWERGLVNHDLGHFSEEAADYDSAARLGMNTPELHDRRSQARLHSGNLIGAASDYFDFVRLRPMTGILHLVILIGIVLTILIVARRIRRS